MNTPKKSGRSKRAQAVKQLTSDQLFFYDHAGYSYGLNETPEQGKIRCAKSLAEAEAAAQRLNWESHWELDPYACIGCDCGSKDCKCSMNEPHETYTSWVTDSAGKSLASLGGICEPAREYIRVVDAELAEEALYGLRKADPFWDVPEPQEVL